MLSQLMKQLPNLDEKNKERPLCFGYSVKARALLHAHFARLELPPQSLDIGKYVCVTLKLNVIMEIMMIIRQQWFHA